MTGAGEGDTALSASQRALLSKRLAEAGLRPGTRRGIPRRPGDGPAPLSFAQLGIWLETEMFPASPAYSMPVGWRISGPLNIAALNASLLAVVQRHEVLRSVLRATDEEPVQVPAAAGPSLRVVDLRATAPDDAAARLTRFTAARIGAPFRLSAEPPLRADLIMLPGGEAYLLLTVHHIAADGWSLGVLSRELRAHYARHTGKPGHELSELTVSYLDYARWQRALSDADHAGELEYWESRLQGMSRALPLPDARDAVTSPSQPGATVGLSLPADLAGKLGQLARDRRTTPFAVLTAGLAALLHRYSGQDDIIIATPVAGRSQPEVQHVIGPFINTVLLRLDAGGRPTFSELLTRASGTLRDALGHQELPLERLAERLRPARDRGGNALYRVLVTHRAADSARLELDGLAVEPDDQLDPGTAKVDLRVEFAERTGAMEVLLTYSTDVLDQAAVTRFAEHLRETLTAMSTDPETPVAGYRLTLPAAAVLMAAQRRAPRATTAEPASLGIGDLLRAQIATSPEHPAIVGEGGTLSYGQLAARAAALAAAVSGQAPAHGRRVAVHGGANVGTAVAMLAGLLAGWTLVPIDAALPVGRRQAMLAASAATCLIDVCERCTESAPCQEDPGDLARQLTSIPVTAVRAATGRLHAAPEAGQGMRLPFHAAGWPDTMVGMPGDGDAAAYLMFTSGTTGAPRGVLGSQAGLAHFLCWQAGEFGVGPADRGALLTSISFDVVLRDLLLPLVSGGTLCVPGSERDDPERLLRWVARHRVSLLHVVPATLAHWLDSVPGDLRLGHVRALFSAGEPLTAALVRRARVTFPRAEIINLYGPTETSLAKCWYRVPDPPLAGVQPVGLPIPGASVQVQTSAGPAPAGVIGEMVITTPFRPLGYLGGDPGNRFGSPRHPAPADNGDQADGDQASPDGYSFRTGDLGRYRPDGLVEVLGRTDRQVKIRGTRVDLDGVTAVLAGHPKVRACAVRVWPREPGGGRLAAYITTVGTAPTASQLLAYLAARLPTPMLPETIVALPSLPRTPNGKVDHGALPAPREQEPAATQAAFTGRNEAERVLLETWREVLAVTEVGSTDNFFAVGGHSLLGLRLFAKLRQRLGVDLPLAVLFEAQTISGLAELVSRAAADGAAAGAIPRRQRTAYRRDGEHQ